MRLVFFLFLRLFWVSPPLFDRLCSVGRHSVVVRQRCSGFPDGTARSCGGAVWATISTPAGSILAQNLAAPESFTLYALETKTTDTTERRIKKNVGFTEAETVETQTPSTQESASVKKAKTMKARTKTAVWITAAILCPAMFGGSAWTWAQASSSAQCSIYSLSKQVINR